MRNEQLAEWLERQRDGDLSPDEQNQLQHELATNPEAAAWWLRAQKTDERVAQVLVERLDTIKTPRTTDPAPSAYQKVSKRLYRVLQSCRALPTVIINCTVVLTIIALLVQASGFSIRGTLDFLAYTTLALMGLAALYVYIYGHLTGRVSPRKQLYAGRLGLALILIAVLVEFDEEALKWTLILPDRVHPSATIDGTPTPTTLIEHPPLGTSTTVINGCSNWTVDRNNGDIYCA